jgi:hypothetical protein
VFLGFACTVFELKALLVGQALYHFSHTSSLHDEF